MTMLLNRKQKWYFPKSLNQDFLVLALSSIYEDLIKVILMKTENFNSIFFFFFQIQKKINLNGFNKMI